MKKMRRSLSTILQLTIDNFDAISPRYCNQTYIESNDPTMMKKLLDSGHKIDDYLSMNILKDMRNDPRCKDEFEGPGIIRIIDKLTCMNLTVLIYSSARCARNSSFTARIIDERINAHNNEFLVLTVMTKLIVVAIIDDLQQEYTRSSKLCVWFPRTWCLKNFIKPNQIISISLISPKNVNNNNSINKKCYHYASVKFYSKRSELFKSNNLFPNQLKFHLPTTTITSTSTIDNLSQLMNNLNISSSSSASLDVNSKIMEKEGETEIVISRSLACNLGVCSVQDKIDNIKFPISFIFEKKIDNIPIATEVILSKLSSPPSTLPLGTRFKQINYYFNQEIFKRANLGSIVSRDSIIYQNGCNGIQLYKVSRVNSSFILTDPADSVARIAESTKLEINVNNNNNVDVDDFRLLLNGFPDKSKWVKDIVNEIGSLDDVVTSIIDQLYTFVITAISANNQGSKKKVFKRSKGILLIGKPGTGKTSLALRIAETSRLPYLIINCPEIFKSDEGIVENQIVLLRRDLSNLRKFLFIMNYRNPQRWSQFTMKKFDFATLQLVEDFMRQHKLQHTREVWLQNIREILDTPHEDIKNNSRIFFIDRDDYRQRMIDGFLVIWQAGENDEFIITSNGFGIFEGVTGTMVGGLPFQFAYHYFYVISPKLALVLCHTSLRNERKEIGSDVWTETFKTMGFKRSILENAPHPAAIPNYVATPKYVPSHEYGRSTDRNPETAFDSLLNSVGLKRQEDDMFTFRFAKIPSATVHLVNSILLNETKPDLVLTFSSRPYLYKTILKYHKSNVGVQHDFSSLKKMLFMELNKTHEEDLHLRKKIPAGRTFNWNVRGMDSES
ncbi:2758_t:CDS:2 [Entrophospora sp. SA101]|nr:2758_t:CDS:2 [Entrophospora sp. SA101]